jgi:two-component system, NtrC family, response regulator HydG
MSGDPSRSILIVDDEPDACANLRDILTDLGYRVDTAGNGPQAIDLVGRTAYDIALLDLKMPGMDGLALYQRIKQLQPETAAIVVSAFAGSELADRAMQEGAAHLVAKPVDMPQLLQAIEGSLAQPLVLVVDDDTDFCENLWQILKSYGYRTALAHSAQQVRNRLTTKSFDVVLVDLKLSDANGGEEVLCFVRETNPQARRILVTGFPHDVAGPIRALLDDGVGAVCTKPVDFDRLIEILRR